MINISFVTNAVVFAFLGVVIFWVSFLSSTWLLPTSCGRRLIEEQQFRPGDRRGRDVPGHLPHHRRGHPRVSPSVWFTRC